MAEKKERDNHNTFKDLTEGSIWRHLFRISVPAITGHFFNILYNWIDNFWGGKIGIEGLASFSFSFPIFLFSIALGQFVASGGMVLVSNAYGAKKIQEAKHYLKQIVLVSALLGISVTILVQIFAVSYLKFLGARGEILLLSTQFIKTVSFGFPFFMCYLSLNVGLVAQGNTKFMRNVLMMNAVINMLLDPLLLYGLRILDITIIPPLGMRGIALATVLVQVLGFILIWHKIQNNESTSWEKGETNRIQTKTVAQIAKYGLPLFVQISMAAVGMSIINFFLSRIGVTHWQDVFSSFHRGGDEAVAAYAIGLRVEQLALVPSIGIGMALSALVGQNNGAKKYLRIRESYNKALLFSLCLWLGIMLPITLFGDRLVGIFSSDFRVVQIAYFYIIYAFVSYMGYQVNGLSTSLLSGMKHPWIPVVLLISRHTVLPLIFIPLYAYYLEKGIYGVFASLVSSVWITGILVVILGRRILNKKIQDTH